MSSSDDRDPVDLLAEEFADRIRRGEHPSVSDYASAHPEHADQLRELLPAVAQIEMLKRFRHPVASESLPERFGDFRIIRELGRGGMGVVFEAMQQSLGRPVALKVLARHAQLDSTRRSRFVREAQAAAKLHHTNIVPVFGVGEQDGLPYYVMQLIPGCGLHTVAAQWRKETGHIGRGIRPTKGVLKDDTYGKPRTEDTPPIVESNVRVPAYGDWRFIAEVAVQAAHALHYAHKQGVLHRDVKPANLIYDGETVWVADFGLAKLMNTDGLTATGDILGTLQYIPPECLAGNADARSDVYGLGATLYELLTLDPPYIPDSPARLIKQVADEDPPRPRKLNANIPRDLETIVLKAMARDPRARYATAQGLAEDLEAFLDDRPIKARRTSAISRAWRWCRRNPAVASLTFTTVVALSCAAIAGWVGYAHAEERRENEEHARREEQSAKDAAISAQKDAQRMSDKLKANLELSLRTFETVFIAAGGTDRMGNGIPLPPLDHIFIGPGGGPRPGGFKGPPPDGFGPPPDRPDGPGFGPPPKKDPPGVPKKDGGPGPSPVEIASDKAAILEAVLNFYDEFAKQNTEQNPQTAALQFEAAKASRRMCEAYGFMLRKPDKAVAAFRRAVGLLEPLVARSPENAAWRTELVLTYASAPPEAFPGDRTASMKRAFELANGDPWLTGLLKLRTGFARDQAGDRAEAESAYRDAIKSLAEPAYRTEQMQIDLASARYQLASLLLGQQKYQAAREVLEKSVEEFRSVAEQLPKGFHVGREWMAHTYLKLALVYEKLNDSRAAEARANVGRFSERLRHFDPSRRGPEGKKDGPRP